VGDSVALGTLPNPNPMYHGTFDSAYFNSVDATGKLYVCGNTGANPILYQVPIIAGAFPLSGLGSSLASLTTASTAPCSPITDFANPNATGGPVERLFISVQDKGLSNGCLGGGCLFNFLDTPWHPSTVYARGQEILDDKLRIEVATTAGTTGSTEPVWGLADGTFRTDGSVVWFQQGLLSAATIPAWLPSHSYTSTNRILDTNGNVQICLTAGTSGPSAPTWKTLAGADTSDGGVGWKNAGPVATFALPAAGGASAVIIDNTVNGSGGSQVYFTTLSDQVCGTSGTGGCAVQASQSALQ
jgi:hypothetical protein